MLLSPARTFLLLGTLFGTGFVFLTPPLQAPDEWMHLRRAYAVSEGTLRAGLRPSPVTGQDSACGEFPDRLLVAERAALFSLPYAPEREAEILALTGLTEDPFAAGRTFNGGRILSLAKQPADHGTRSVLCYPNTALHPPHLYFAQGLGMALGRWLGLPMVALMYLGRLCNLALWLVLTFLALRALPAFRWLFLLLALTPTALFQAASLSADAATNGLSMLLIALFLRRAYGGEADRPGLLLLSCLAALVSVSKLSFPLVLAVFLIPRERFAGPDGRRRAFLTLAGCAALSLLAWGLYAHGLYTPLRRLPPVSWPDQLRHILLHPFTYIGVLGNTLALKTPHYLVTFVGQLGHHALRLPAAAAALHLLILLFVSAADDAPGLRLPAADRLRLAAIAVVASLWMMTTQYLSWTPVGAGIIEGVYGRYFLPAAPLFFLLFQGLLPPGPRRPRFLPAAAACWAGVLLTGAAHALTSYWGG